MPEVNPPPLARWKAAGDAFVPWLQLVALVAGGLFALIQYAGSIHDARVAKSFAMYERFSRDNLLVARDRIDRTWLKWEPDAVELLLELKKEKLPEMLNKRWGTFVVKVIHDADIAADVVAVSDYFDELFSCIDSGICDEAATRFLFAQQAKVFYDQNFCFIDHRRRAQHDPHFAVGVERLSGRKSAVQSAVPCE
jgi:hypothetical protein